MTPRPDTTAPGLPAVVRPPESQGDVTFGLNQRLVLRAMPTMPEFTSARRLAEQMPYLSRSVVDKTLKSLRSSVFVLDGDGGRLYAKYREGSLL